MKRRRPTSRWLRTCPIARSTAWATGYISTRPTSSTERLTIFWTATGRDHDRCRAPGARRRWRADNIRRMRLALIVGLAAAVLAGCSSKDGGNPTGAAGAGGTIGTGGSAGAAGRGGAGDGGGGGVGSGSGGAAGAAGTTGAGGGGAGGAGGGAGGAAGSGAGGSAAGNLC